MARRTIGQERMEFAASGGSPLSTLEGLSRLIDWSAIDGLLADIHAAAKGEAAWPPLAMVKALLLSIWYDLSDVKRAEAPGDRASFRRFCGFSKTEATPERTAFVRFRKALIARGLDARIFAAATAQLKAQAVTIKTGTIVDATIIASASKDDDEARWVKHKNKTAVHGFKAHVGADADTALIEKVVVTPANVNDGTAGPEALPDNPGETFADSAYRGRGFGDAVKAKGGRALVVATGMWGLDEQETQERLADWNRPIHRIRARIEKISGTAKRSYGLRRMRWRGLAKAALQVRFTAVACNSKRTLNINAARIA